MVIDKPIDPKEYSLENHDGLMTKVRNVIVHNFYNENPETRGKNSP